jgi:cytochrome c
VPFTARICFVAGSIVFANGAVAMQAARCGYRAGISGSFCESLATRRPHVRRREPASKLHPRLHPPLEGRVKIRSAASRFADLLLFWAETARYYHRRFSATYSLCTLTVTHMTKRRATTTSGLGLCAALLVVTGADAQMALPEARPPDGATLFKQQCATCHTTNLTDATRQGPPLFKIVGKPAGKADGFRYSAGFAKADFVWDETKLDAYLTNPQATVPGSIMAYRQAKAETRTAIIAYLKELN